MDANVLKLADIAEKRLGIRFTKQILAVVLILFGVEKKRIIEGLGVSRFSIKRYGELIAGGNIEAIFEDRVYRQKSEMEDYKTGILAELEKAPPRTLREAAAAIERASGLKRSIP
jgi:hypothetical protein